MYYLETNALRILSKKLISPVLLNKCYSSILSVSEILSGIHDDVTYNQRKGIIKKVYLSNIRIDLDLPETKIFKAYGIEVNSNVPNNILIIGDILINSEFFVDFINRINLLNLAEYWNFLKIYDKVSDVKFKESYKDRQDQFDYSDPNMIPDFNDRWNNLTDKPDLRRRILNDLIIYFANKHLEPNSKIKVLNKTLEDLIKEYDHSLNIFFLCIGYYTGTKIIFKNAPSRNDYFDLNHLVYLRNESDIIVSNDSMLTKLINKIYPGNILSASDLETILEK